MNEELKPCPKCKSKAICGYSYRTTYAHCTNINCKHEPIILEIEDLDKAIELWNKKAGER